MSTSPSSAPATTTSPPATSGLVQVLADCVGIEGLLTYSIPAGMTIHLGDILTVPLGNRYVGAVALEFGDLAAPEQDITIKPVYGVVSSGVLPQSFWELIAKTADYYRTPLIQTAKAALPPKLLDRSSYRIRLNPDAIADEAELSIAAREVLNFLQAHATSKNGNKSHKKGISRRYLHQKLPRHASAGLKQLQQLGLVSLYLEPPHKPQPKYEDVAILLQFPPAEVTNRQKEILTVLQRMGGECVRAELIRAAKTTHGSLRKLEENGYIAIEARESLRLGDKDHLVAADQPKQLTDAQSQALAAIEQLAANPGGDQTVLLHGVTGSGKTEVYLQAIAPLLDRGKSALVLVPEIGLTPQLTDRFRARFGDARVNVYHSQLADGERFDTWRQMLNGNAQVVIGTRSAVFAPLPNLGLIVLDEEHDSSFKQSQPQPCYHARTVAQWRSQMSPCPLILGSATPSAEILDQVGALRDLEQALEKDVERALEKAIAPENIDPEHNQTGEVLANNPHYLSLPQRIGNKPMPPISIVDMRLELENANYSIFSRKLQGAIANLLEQKQQGILFIHRRGYNTFVSCRSCGFVMKCPYCDVSLSYHNIPFIANPDQLEPAPPTYSASPYAKKEKPDGSLLCHYCGHRQIKPRQCPVCDSPYFKHFGSGTQRVESELQKLFPQARLIRFDSDTTRNKNQHRQLIEQFQAGEADLLVGTQMLSKGLDIPQVTLVGVVSADGLLNFSDYRASERAFQVLTQVAGRAGRGQEPGQVIIQTYTPEHATIEAVKNYRFAQFITTEIKQRKVFNYPPLGQMALIHLSSTSAIAVADAAKQLAANLEELEPRWQILGPAPAAIARLKNRFRWQILLKFSTDLHHTLPTLDKLKMLVGDRQVRVTIDVDPLDIL
jgi:primosomal protein N' (replication factor Y)